ncbi:MAG: hypothetical protein JRD68_01340 [Deltaproteobacteria bacterium]|nr:hypothetical protein [Deltaproteobacteria bacterium]
MPTPLTTTQILFAMIRLYRRCLEITSDVVEKEDLPDDAALAEVFIRRASILKKVEALTKNLVIEQRDEGPALVGLNDGDQKKAEEHLATLRSIITDLIELDRKLEERLKQEMDWTEHEINRLQQGESMLKAYTPFKGGISYYVDHQG